MPRSSSRLCAGLLLTLAARAALAVPQADICYGPSVALGSTQVSTNSTVFACPLAGNHTLPELAALGWVVVQLVPVVNSATTQADQLVIQHP